MYKNGKTPTAFSRNCQAQKVMEEDNSPSCCFSCADHVYEVLQSFCVRPGAPITVSDCRDNGDRILKPHFVLLIVGLLL